MQSPVEDFYWVKWSAMTADGQDLWNIESVPKDGHGKQVSRDHLLGYMVNRPSDDWADLLRDPLCPRFYEPKKYRFGDLAGNGGVVPNGLWIVSERLYRLVKQNQLRMVDYYQWIPILVLRGRHSSESMESKFAEVFYVVRAEHQDRRSHSCLEDFDKESVFSFIFATKLTHNKRKELSAHWRLKEPPDVDLFQTGEIIRDHGYVVTCCTRGFKTIIEREGYSGFSFY